MRLSTKTAEGTQPRHTVRAALWMLAAVALFAIMDACLKLLSGYPPFQVATLRAAASLPLVLVWAWLTIGFAALARPRWSLHLLRGAIGIVMLAAFIYALRTLPLSTAYSIFFVSPLIITALSALVLGERVGLRRWSAVVGGLVGVLVILRPTGEGVFTIGGVAVLVSAVCYAVSAITIRVLGRTDSTQSMVVWLLAMLTLGSGVLALPAWTPIERGDWLIIAGVGVSGALGQVALTEAFRLGEASVIAPLEYTALAWGLGLDLFLWQVLPDTVTWIGATIIIFSGLYLMRREAEPDPEGPGVDR